MHRSDPSSQCIHKISPVHHGVTLAYYKDNFDIHEFLHGGPGESSPRPEPTLPFLFSFFLFTVLGRSRFAAVYHCGNFAAGQIYVPPKTGHRRPPPHPFHPTSMKSTPTPFAFGDLLHIPPRVSNHPTLETMHPLRLQPSAALPVRVLAAGKIAWDPLSVVRTVPTPRSCRDLL